jgi:hypothetical protein
LGEAKRLTALAASQTDLRNAVVSLTIAVNILIGLVEGHRHGYLLSGGDGFSEELTGPMQAMEGR